MPQLEVASRENASIKDPVLLQRHADAYAQVNSSEVITWDIEVDPDAYPSYGEWHFGDRARFSVKGHPWVDDGEYTHRLLGLTRGSGTAKLETTTALVS
jgi:hypothetical protein